jgi:transposase
MDVREREAGDLAELKRRARRERDALRRDRLRAVALAIEGVDAPGIATMLGRARRSVQEWVYAYRDGGIVAVQPPKRPGRRPRLPREREAELRARLEAGPGEQDGVCVLRGKDVQRILDREFGVRLSLNAAYATLHRLGYSCLAPRPRHEKQDRAKQEAFKRATPLFSVPSGVRSLQAATGSACSSWMRPDSGSRGR